MKLNAAVAVRFFIGTSRSKSRFGALKGLIALDLVLVVCRAIDPVEALLPFGRVHVTLITLLPLLFLEAGVPPLIGTTLGSKEEGDEKNAQKT